MSSFERLPQEIRNMIYGYCLIHDGDIIPYPNIDEIAEIEESGGRPAKRCLERLDFDNVEISYPIRPCGGINYATDWPSVALLGVSTDIREQAARILFGMNVWRLSFVEQWDEGTEKHLWYSYARHFRHVSTHMSLNDAGNLLEPIKRVRAEAKSQRWCFNRMTDAIHEESFRVLVCSFAWKHEILARMQLKSILFDVENLVCPQGCCRIRLLKHLCQEIGQGGPWYRWEFDKNAGRSWDVKYTTRATYTSDVDGKRKVDVKVLGLLEDDEKKIFMDY